MLDVRYTTAFKLYPYVPVAAQQRTKPDRHTVVVVSGGPVGMTMALDLGRKGVPVLVLDDHDGVGQGSRAICFARRTLKIADRLGCGSKIDFQLGWDIDRQVELKPARIRSRVDSMLGEGIEYELEWTGIYTFSVQSYRRQECSSSSLVHC